MSSHSKTFLCYIAGSALWFVLLSLMTATRGTIFVCIGNYLALTAGFALGYYCNQRITRDPWLLLFVPSIPLVLGIFV